MRTWRSAMRVLLVAAAMTAAAGCVYYNTFFNAKKKFEQAEKQSEALTSSAGPARFSVGNRAYEEAIERFSRVIERYPKSKWVDDAYYYIGLGYFRMAQYAKAERAFREILANHPKSRYTEECSYWLAVCKVRSGETSSGRQMLRRLAHEAQKKKWRAAAWYELGELFLADKEYDSAAAMYLTVVDQYSGEREAAEAQFYAAEALRLAGRQDEALAHYRRTLHKDLTPDLVYRTRVRMADAFLGQGELDSGLALLETLAEDKRHRDSLGVLRVKIGAGLEQAGRFDEAIQTYEQVIDQFPKTAWSAEAYYHLGYIQQKVHFDFVAARDLYQKARDEFARSEFAQKAVELAVTMANIEGYREQIAPKKAASDSTDTSRAGDGGEVDSGAVADSGRVDPPPEVNDSTSMIGPSPGKTPDTATAVGVPDSSTPSAPAHPDTTSLPGIDTTAPGEQTASEASAPDSPASTISAADSVAPGSLLSGVKTPDYGTDSVDLRPVPDSANLAPADSPAVTTAVAWPDSIGDLDTVRVSDTLVTIDTLVVVDTTWSFDTTHLESAVMRPEAFTTGEGAGIADTAAFPDPAILTDSAGLVALPFVVDTTLTFDSSYVVDTLVMYDTTLVFDTAAVIRAEKAAQESKAAVERRAAEELKLATAYFKLAEAFHTILEVPDSALFYYDALVARFPTNEHVPRALFASAAILEERFADTSAAAERYRRVLEEYRRTDFAGEAIRRLGLTATPVDTGYPAAVYRQAERLVLEENRPDSARVLFTRVMKEFPGSFYAPMAAYANAVVAEKTHATEDSTVWHLYQQVVDSFPNTAFAAAAKARIGAGTAAPRRERQRVVLAETPQVGKVDSALAAIQAEQADTTIVRLPRAPRPEKAGEFVYPTSELGSEPWRGSVMFKIWIDLTGRISEFEMVQPSQRSDIDVNAETAVKETFFNPDSIPPESLNMWYLYEVRVLPPAQKPENIFNDPLYNNP